MQWREYTTIGQEEEDAVVEVIRSGKLSGFIAGPPERRAVIPNGGEKVQELEKLWSLKYGVKHAISFNSATTALMAAYTACEVSHNHVITTPWTMSATVSAAIWSGARIDFADIEDKTFCIDPNEVIRVYENNSIAGHETKAVCAVNLFGHPAQLALLRSICKERGMFLIEDSAQTPWAHEDNRIAGTIGDIGVYSLNRHKHIHCGEGGIAVTDNDELATRMRSVRNHGVDPVGLNLRMTELEAAIAICQINKLSEAVLRAQNIGIALNDALREYMDVPFPREGCSHNYYLWTAKTQNPLRGIPHIKGYIQPLNGVFGGAECSVTDRMREETICFEAAKWANEPEEIAAEFVKSLTS